MKKNSYKVTHTVLSQSSFNMEIQFSVLSQNDNLNFTYCSSCRFIDMKHIHEILAFSYKKLTYNLCFSRSGVQFHLKKIKLEK